MISLKAQAIETALMGDWNNAVLLNQLLLGENPDDIDTLNRLAFAQASQGNIKDAQSLYQKVLTLDMQNPIAIRNLKRLSDGNSVGGHTSGKNMNNIFIEESGKTKVIDLRNVADKKVISPLRSGEDLILQSKRMKIFVLNSEKVYIGMLPDDISQRLINFIEEGNEYEAYVKTVDNNKVSIFIKETKRVAKFLNEPSFVSNTSKFTLSQTNGKNHTKPTKQNKDEDDSDQEPLAEESL